MAGLLTQRRLATGLLVLAVAGALLAVAVATGWWEANRAVFLQAVVTGLLIGGVLGLVSIGLSLIFGVLNIINFAHGTLMTVGLYIAFLLFERFGVDPYLSLLVTVPALFLLGVALQKGLINPVMEAPLHNQLLLTLGVALFLQNLLLVVFTATPRSMELAYSRAPLALGPWELSFPLRVMGAVITLPRLLAFLFALALSGALFTLLQRTALGTAIRAASQDPEGAYLVGIDVPRMYVLTFGLGAACVGAASSLVLPFLFVSPTAGEVFTIIAFVVVVLGGLGNVHGALFGGLLIGLTQELGQVFLPAASKMLGVFVVFVLVLLLKPEGLFGKPT